MYVRALCVCVCAVCCVCCVLCEYNLDQQVNCIGYNSPFYSGRCAVSMRDNQSHACEKDWPYVVLARSYTVYAAAHRQKDYCCMLWRNPMHVRMHAQYTVCIYYFAHCLSSKLDKCQCCFTLNIVVTFTVTVTVTELHVCMHACTHKRMHVRTHTTQLHWASISKTNILCKHSVVVVVYSTGPILCYSFCNAQGSARKCRMHNIHTRQQQLCIGVCGEQRHAPCMCTNKNITRRCEQQKPLKIQSNRRSGV